MLQAAGLRRRSALGLYINNVYFGAQAERAAPEKVTLMVSGERERERNHAMPLEDLGPELAHCPFCPYSFVQIKVT